MKFKNILSLNIFMVFAFLAGSGENRPIPFVLQYIPVNFLCPIRDPKVSGIDHSNDPIPSKVGFYDGDMKKYLGEIEKQYPDGACLLKREIKGKVEKEGSELYEVTSSQKRKINGTVLTEKSKKYEIQDDTSSQRTEHIIQDAVMQELILAEMDSLEYLTNQRDNAYTSKTFYQTIACFGINLLFTKKPLLINKQILKEETAKARAQKYVQVKQGLLPEDFESLISDLAKKMSSQKVESQQEFLHNQLSEPYNKMRDKVAINYQISNLNKEKRIYQGVIMATTVTALGISGYLWAKNNK